MGVVSFFILSLLFSPFNKNTFFLKINKSCKKQSFREKEKTMVACGLFCSNFDDENLKESVTKFIPLAYFFEIQYFKFDEFELLLW